MLGAAKYGAPVLNEKKEAGKISTEQKLLDLALTVLDDGKANDVVSIDLRGKSPISDHMVIASGTSARHVSTLAEKVTEALKRDGGVTPRLEGAEQGDWVLIDAADIVVHIFRPEVREFYDLESMWSDTRKPTVAKAGLDS